MIRTLKALSLLSLILLVGPHAQADPDAEDKTKKTKKAAKAEPASEIPSDRRPAMRVGDKPVLIRGATLLTATQGRLEKSSLLIEKGKITAIGKDLKAPEGAIVIDGQGRFVMPGVIDCHSHMAIEGGVNEMADKISPEVRIGDVINHEDVTIYRALAGGVTSAQLLHGSANPIGGQAVVIKLRYGQSAEDLVFKQAPRGIKMALGENPKRVGRAFPKTRQGIMATMRRCFDAGRRYQRAWDKYRRAKAKGENVSPPRRDLRLETYVGILSGEIKVHCHCYRADEILALMKVAEDYGFRIQTFQHVLEGYKIAPEIARHGAMGSTFSDWWAYKIEAFDAIPQNAALMTEFGVNMSINSDSPELIRHLPLEAAKSSRYGHMKEQEILQLITINPAKQLGVDKWTGSLELGKDADLSIWNGHPLSVFSRVEWTFVDGQVYFQREAKSRSFSGDFKLPKHKRLRFKTHPQGEYLFKNFQLHTGLGTVETGHVHVRDGRIVSVRATRSRKKPTRLPRSVRVINGGGQLHLSPGFIDGGTQLGLVEIESAEETIDTRVPGFFQPDLLAYEGVNPHSELIPVTRLCGTTMSLTVPTGAAVPGQACLMHLDGTTVDEMIVEPKLGLVLNYPAGAKDGKNPRMKKIDEWLNKAREYDSRREQNKSWPLKPKLEAMRPYIHGTKPILVSITRGQDIVACVEWARKQKLEVVLRGAADAWKVADYLAKRKVPVIYGPVMSVPHGEFTPYDARYKAPAVLKKAGVLFAIQTGEASNARILPFEAGMAAAFGLEPEAALSAITLAPAKILGIDADYGSLESGKFADLIITRGHPLEPSSQVLAQFIKGRRVSLKSKQTDLYTQFRQRNRRVLKQRGAK